MQKLNSDCNLTAGLEAVLRVAVGARVMLRRNIDTSQGLVKGVQEKFLNTPQNISIKSISYADECGTTVF